MAGELVEAIVVCHVGEHVLHRGYPPTAYANDDNDYGNDDGDAYNTRARTTTTTSAYNTEGRSAHLRGWGQDGITTPLLPSIFWFSDRTSVLYLGTLLWPFGLGGINQAPKCIIQRVKLEQSWRDTQVKTLSEADQYWLRHHPGGRYLSQY